MRALWLGGSQERAFRLFSAACSAWGSVLHSQLQQSLPYLITVEIKELNTHSSLQASSIPFLPQTLCLPLQGAKQFSTHSCSPGTWLQAEPSSTDRLALPGTSGCSWICLPFPASVDLQLKASILLDRKSFRTEVFCIVFSTLTPGSTPWAE